MPTANLASMPRLFRIGAYIAVSLVVCGYVTWKLIGVWDQTLHGAEYRKRLAITAANIFDPNNLNNPDDALKIYGVNIVHTIPPFRHWFIGYGIYLGKGKVITAAHVVGRWPSLTKPRVFIAGQDLPATIIRQGSVDRVDLALLSVDQNRLPVSLRLRKNVLCSDQIRVGTNVIVVYPEKIVRSRIVSPLFVAPEDQLTFGTLINEPEGSGSGVFFRDTKCLLGIVSREIKKFVPQYEGRHIEVKPNGFAGYFVPASQIRKFLPSQFEF